MEKLARTGSREVRERPDREVMATVHLPLWHFFNENFVCRKLQSLPSTQDCPWLLNGIISGSFDIFGLEL